MYKGKLLKINTILSSQNRILIFENVTFCDSKLSTLFGDYKLEYLH